MSITGVVDCKKPSHRRNDSGELDVFEAARYFSEYNDNFTLVGGSHRNHHPMMVIQEERDHQGHAIRKGRISLDIPSLKHHHYYHHHHQQQQQVKEKKHKQPSSPGGKLAHFLNSLFSQTISSKKKKSSSSSSTTQSMKDIIINDDESPNGRRKRRSSISHFSLRSTTSSSAVVDTKSLYSCSSGTNSGFRTPPPYALNTPTKSYREFRSFNSDHNNKEVLAKKEYDQKHKFIKNGVVEKPKNNISKNNNHGYFQEKKRDHQVSKFKEEIDDGAESDSSSDLFELQIDYGFGFCSSGLPVYETTHMDNIKRSSTTHAITNGPFKN